MYSAAARVPVAVEAFGGRVAGRRPRDPPGCWRRVTSLPSPGKGVVRRAAFDIGSGMCKLQVADVDVACGHIVKSHYEVEVEVLFGGDWKASGSANCLSEEIQTKGLRVFGELTAIAKELGAEGPSVAIATEVFRKAQNGQEFVHRVTEQSGIRVHLIQQAEEARLGLLSAIGLSGAAPGNVLAWDSGGGSFQVTAAPENIQDLQNFLGPWGSSVATAALVELQGGLFTTDSSPNPVAAGDADDLVEHIKASLGAPPAWLQGMMQKDGCTVVGIGGDTCIFRVCSQLIGKTEGITSQDVRAALGKVVEKGDEEISADVPLQPRMAVPKMCLMVAVMEHLMLPEVTYQTATGSCAGLLVHDSVLKTDKYWGRF